MENVRIVSSRAKSFFYALGIFIFGLMVVVLREKESPFIFWVSEILIGVGVLVLAWNLIRPHRLSLDDEGFTLTGGLYWFSKRVLWRDVEQFVEKSQPHGGSFIGVRFRPDAKRSNLAGRLGMDEILPSGWKGSNEEMVSYLNVCRIIAMNRMTKSD